MIPESRKHSADAAEAEVRRLIAASRLAGWLAAGLDGAASAWRSSTCRLASLRFASPILDSRAATATTVAIAAIVALLGLRLLSAPEPAVWVVPAAVLVVALITAVRALAGRGRDR